MGKIDIKEIESSIDKAVEERLKILLEDNEESKEKNEKSKEKNEYESKIKELEEKYEALIQEKEKQKQNSNNGDNVIDKDKIKSLYNRLKGL